MHDFAKRLIPTRLLKRLRAARVVHNRRSLANTARRQSPLVLTTDNLVEHYYHFLFDLCLPLHLLLESAPDATVTVDTTGPFLPRIEWLFPNRVTIASDVAPRERAGKHVLLGMNPFLVHVTRSDLASFAQHIRSVVGVQHSAARNVLLIERLPPEPFFRTAATKRGAGASRRHIPNHEAVADVLRSWVRAPYEFHNVQLEQIPFAEQVRLFAGATLVVGQHGAGLANCLWMAAGATVLELGNDPGKSHFRTLCEILGHRHVLLRTAGAHDPVDVEQFTAVLKGDVRLIAALAVT